MCDREGAVMRKTSTAILEWVAQHRTFVYWYGGKRDKCTKALADALKRENPSVWTEFYYKEALKDVAAGYKCCDCSGFVCGAYSHPDIGTSAMQKAFSVWSGAPRAGMIAWKRGHCGIFLRDGWDSPIAEMRGLVYDFQCNRTFKTAGFTKVLYSKDVDYGRFDDGTLVGWHVDSIGYWYRHTKGTGPSTYFHDTVQNICGHVYAFSHEGYVVLPPGAPPFFEDWLIVPPDKERGYLS